MRAALLRAPAPLLALLATLLLAPSPPRVAANPHPLASKKAGFSYDELFARWDCSGELCGWNDQLCCSAGSQCYTDAANQAQCSYAATSAAVGGGAGGYWEYFTTTYTLTDLQTITSTGSYYGGGVATYSAPASATARCNYALQETPCGDVCCASDQYCLYSGQCAQNSLASTVTTTTVAGGGGGGPVTGVLVPPVLGTSSRNTITTATVAPTTTVPYETPVATGANVTMTEANSGGGGLSGGAIAGIVIGVLLGLALLALLCFCCCVKGLLDGCLALFGLGGRKRRRTEVEEYERHTHHSSRGGGRTWYGAAKPSRVDRRDRRDSHKGRNAAGILGGLGALWAVLGLKRHHNRKNNEKYSDYSYSDSSYLGTSESESTRQRFETGEVNGFADDLYR